jgi:hypothetical protein
MTNNTPDKRTWTDSQLAAAVAVSRSWRGVMRELGLNSTSAGAVRVVKRHVSRLALDVSHFTGQRRWSDAQLRRAVANAYSWHELVSDLGLAPGSGDERTRIKAHAIRLGLNLSQLGRPEGRAAAERKLEPDIKHLRDAGTMMAAAWFMLCGCDCSIPLEPAVYDLLVSMPAGLRAVQVKTTTHKDRDGWQVQIGRRPYSVGNRGRLVPYDPDIVDCFFILDGDLAMYLIPSRVLAGRVGILLRNYTQYVVGDAGSLMRVSAPAA